MQLRGAVVAGLAADARDGRLGRLAAVARLGQVADLDRANLVEREVDEQRVGLDVTVNEPG